MSALSLSMSPTRSAPAPSIPTSSASRSSETTRWLEVAPKGLHAPRIVLYKAEGQWQDRAGGFQPFVFASPDVNATYQELSGRGVEFTAPPKREPWGMWAQFKDPDGNEFGLYEEPAP